MAYFTTLYSGSSGNCGLVREGNNYFQSSAASGNRRSGSIGLVSVGLFIRRLVPRPLRLASMSAKP